MIVRIARKELTEMLPDGRARGLRRGECGSKLLARYYEDHPELATGDSAQAMNDFHIVRVAVTPLIFQKVSVTAFEDVPRFAFEEEATGVLASRVGWNLVGLDLPAGAMVWLGLRRMRRYPIVAS